MSVSGIDAITFGASDLATCRRFFADWGLSLVSETPQELLFESLNGCQRPYRALRHTGAAARHGAPLGRSRAGR